MKKALVLLVVAALAGQVFGFAVSHSQNLGCNSCHSPHNANTTVVAPLWQAGTINTTGFTLYGGGTTVSGSTALCMTCHDGTDAGTAGTAVDSLDLTDMHPVSALLTVGAEYQTPTLPVKLESGNVECGSCHDVHTSAATASTAGALRVAAGSLCIECHTK